MLAQVLASEIISAMKVFAGVFKCTYLLCSCFHKAIYMLVYYVHICEYVCICFHKRMQRSNLLVVVMLHLKRKCNRQKAAENEIQCLHGVPLNKYCKQFNLQLHFICSETRIETQLHLNISLFIRSFAASSKQCGYSNTVVVGDFHISFECNPFAFACPINHINKSSATARTHTPMRCNGRNCNFNLKDALRCQEPRKLHSQLFRK